MNQQKNSGNDFLCDDELPERFENFIDQDEYDELIGMIVDRFEERSEKIVKLKDGVIYAKTEDAEFIKEAQYSLDNLVRQIYSYDTSEWEPMIHRFFDAASKGVSLKDLSLKDFKKIKNQLRILVKPLGFFKSEETKSLISKQHFPRTRSALAISMGGYSSLVQQEDAERWEVSVEDLFDQAMYNTSKVNVSRIRSQIGDQVPIHTIGGSDFAASRLIEMEKNEPWLIGKKGAIFGIPCNGIVFGSPIDDLEEANRVFRALIPVVSRAYRLEPSPVVFDLFIYQDGEIVSSMSDFKKSNPGLYALMEIFHLFKPMQ